MNYLKQLKVLVIEPGKYLAGIVRDALQNALGIPAVFQCASATEGLEIASVVRVNLLLVKIDSDCPDGLPFVERIRSGVAEIPQDLPIVAMTAAPTRCIVERLRDLGVNEILALPITPKALTQRIQSVFEHPRDWVVSEAYVGPDRRRKKGGLHQGPERRGTDDATLLTDELENPEPRPPVSHLRA